jgi:hypothetical protein
MSSNAVLQTTVVLMLLAHVGALLGIWYGPRSHGFLLSLNILIAACVLAYAASRLRYVLGGHEPRQLLFFLLELLILVSAILAFRHSRPAAVVSYVGFGLHFLATLAAVIFAFTFKMRLF